jgi:hypothetical protein
MWLMVRMSANDIWHLFNDLHRLSSALLAWNATNSETIILRMWILCWPLWTQPLA